MALCCYGVEGQKKGGKKEGGTLKRPQEAVKYGSALMVLDKHDNRRRGKKKRGEKRGGKEVMRNWLNAHVIGKRRNSGSWPYLLP